MNYKFKKGNKIFTATNKPASGNAGKQRKQALVGSTK
jgi:hypothetical protein